MARAIQPLGRAAFTGRVIVLSLVAVASVFLAAADANQQQENLSGPQAAVAPRGRGGGARTTPAAPPRPWLDDSAWWDLTGLPDLGQWNKTGMQPVDFSVWQAADGSWQLESCIRGTAIGGNTRLLYRYEGAAITSGQGWHGVGVSMVANVSVGETAGGLQAPHVTKWGDTYHKFYGTWDYLAQAVSTDGKHFSRVLDEMGQATIFCEGSNASNTRDPMLLGVPAGPNTTALHLFYSAFPGGVTDSDYARVLPAVAGNESAALLDFGAWRAAHSTLVAGGGSAGTSRYSSECPFVVHHEASGYFFLFRTQHYGPAPPPGGDGGMTHVYASRDPTTFGSGDAADAFLVAVLPVCAPEIVTTSDGRFVIVALKPGLDGMRATWLHFGA